MKWSGYTGHHNSWEPEENLNCDELILAFEKKRAIKFLGKFYFAYGLSYHTVEYGIESQIYILFFINTGIAHKDGEWAYLIQFKDAKEPDFVNFSASRIWSELTFDFLMENLKYSGLSSDANRTEINILSESAVLHGTAEIICEC